MVKITLLKLKLPYFKVNTALKNKALQNRIAGENKDEIPGLRIHNKGGKGNIQEDYAYPMVQYRSENGTGVLFAINAGIKDLINFYNNIEVSNVLKTEINITKWDTKDFYIKLEPKSKTYFSENYIVLDSENKTIFDSITDDVEMEFQQKCFLEEKIIAHLLEFCKRVNFETEHHLWVRVVDFDINKPEKFIKINLDKSSINYALYPFSIKFQTNLHFPDEIALGKEKAIGYGIVKSVKI